MLAALDVFRRCGAACWSGQTTTAALKRRIEDLVAYLFREDEFPDGVILSTGTCLVPDAQGVLVSNGRTDATTWPLPSTNWTNVYLEPDGTVNTTNPGRTATFLNLMPFVVIVMAWALLGEAVHAYHVVGAVLVIAGVVLTTR